MRLSRHERLLELAWVLAGCHAHEQFADAALRSIRDLAHADDAGAVEVTVTPQGAPDFAVDTFPGPEDAEDVAARMRRSAGDDARITSWVGRRSPFRMSDVMTQERFHETRVYSELFVPWNLEYQIQMPLHPVPGVAGEVMYCVMRGGPDFTDEEVGFAGEVQATLNALHAAAWAGPAPPEAAEVACSVRLTPREQDVLRLMASGMTAVAIGRARLISPRTVNKHLENVYAKLEAHDRVLALNRARQLGLLPR